MSNRRIVMIKIDGSLTPIARWHPPLEALSLRAWFYRDPVMRKAITAALFITSICFSGLALSSPTEDLRRFQAECQSAQTDLLIVDKCSVVTLNSKDRAALERAFNRRGLAFMRLGRYAEAASDFTQVIRLNPKIAGYYDNRQNAYKSMKRLDDALADANVAVRLAPTFSFVFNGRANVYMELERYDTAVNDFSAALSLAPLDAGLHIGRGDAFRRSGKFDDAIADYSKAFELDGKAYAIRQRGLAFQAAGRSEQARSDLLEFLRSTPDDKEAQDALRAITPREVVRDASNSERAGPLPAGTDASETHERRIALVIGNSTYRHVPQLANPGKDAAKVADALASNGIAVSLRLDLTREELINALAKFSVDSETADWAVMYYAGHGIEIGGDNYMIPVDAELATERSVQYEAVTLAQFKNAVEGAHKLKLVIVDACRANPFAIHMRLASATRAPTRGLARPPEYDPGTLIVYAAREGEVAIDGTEAGNSPFATAFVREALKPGIEIRRLFDFVRDDVIEATGGAQHPFTYGSLPGRADFYIARGSTR